MSMAVTRVPPEPLKTAPTAASSPHEPPHGHRQLRHIIIAESSPPQRHAIGSVRPAPPHLPGATTETPPPVLTGKEPPGHRPTRAPRLARVPLRTAGRIPSWARPTDRNYAPQCGPALCARVFKFSFLFITLKIHRKYNKTQKNMK
jgi:hypothetical protein